MKPRLNGWLLAVITVLLLSACSQADEQTVSQAAPTSIPPAAGELLPHSLYFLSDLPDGLFQVWRMAADGQTLEQITDEANGVSDFDVFQDDGRVVYISANRLYLINSDGSGRTLLVDGGEIDEESSSYHYTGKLSGVSWAGHGRVIAYGLNGIHLYFINEESDFYVAQNDVEQDAEGVLTPVALYQPISWSPDGNFLLVEIEALEGGTLGVYSMQSNEIVRLGGDSLVCCQPVWTTDSSAVLVASDLFGASPAGLWRYDALTGGEIELVHHTSEDDTLNFVNWPLQLSDGSLRYFYTNMAAFPANEPPLLMVSSDADGVSGRALIRSEHWVNYEVLWAEDGSLALAVQPATGVQAAWPRTGPIVIIPASGDPVIPLAANGYSLRWGP